MPSKVFIDGRNGKAVKKRVCTRCNKPISPKSGRWFRHSWCMPRDPDFQNDYTYPLDPFVSFWDDQNYGESILDDEEKEEITFPNTFEETFEEDQTHE